MPHASRPWRRRLAACLPIVLLLGLLGGCRLFSSATPLAEESDFVVYRLADPACRFPIASTYAWRVGEEDVNAPDPAGRQQLHQCLRRSLSQALGRQGYRLVEADDQAQYLVRYHTVAEGEETDRLLNRRYDPAATWRPFAPEAYLPGTIVVDLADRRANRLVWRGAILAPGLDELALADRQQRLDKAADQLFNLFPPGMAGPGQYSR